MANILQFLGSIPNGSTRRIPLYTGVGSQTVAVTISKNGVVFGNPSAGQRSQVQTWLGAM